MNAASDPVLVTGANGFIGSAVVRHLLTAGWRVRALVRGHSRLDNLAGLDVELVRGDLRDPASLRRAVQGCRGVFHVAADYRLWARDPEAMYAVNVQGSRHVLQAAREAGVERVVYTSSVATLGMRADAHPADETTPTGLDAMLGDYKRSKYLAEQAVRELAAAEDLDVVIVHPAAPVGPGDIRPTPTGRMVLDAARGRMPAWMDTGLDIVHVDDVAEGHRLAFERGVAGRGYILGGDNMALRDIIARVARLAGRRGPWFRMPYHAALPMAHAAEALARMSGHVPSVTVAGVRLARSPMYFSHRRASDELGYRPRPADDALGDAVRWFAANGCLRLRG